MKMYQKTPYQRLVVHNDHQLKNIEFYDDL